MEISAVLGQACDDIEECLLEGTHRELSASSGNRSCAPGNESLATQAGSHTRSKREHRPVGLWLKESPAAC